MYFNNSKEDTNIDAEFENKKLFDFQKFKIPLIVICTIILLIIIIIIISSKSSSKYHIELKGESVMTIYQGYDYTEPGYTAYDKNKNDLTQEVIQSGTVDSSKVGSYVITYSLNNVKITRVVNVVTKPEAITYIYLNGNRNMTLKLGEKYVEPGYTATDTIDGDITNKVEVKNNVNINKQGIYTITYTVTNSEGKTATATRIIEVK